MNGRLKPLRLAVVGMILFVGGCSTMAPVERAPVVTPPEDSVAPAQQPAPARLQPVAIVISSDADIYQGVASALFSRGGYDFTKYSLDNASGPVIAELIAKRAIEDVITVGEQAARSIRPSDGFNVYYCQVFAETELQAAGYQGVSALPPFALQLAHWREVDPGLGVVGVVAGPEMELYVEELQAAATEFGVTLRYEQVATDKEALFVFKRMVPEIDGYIFLPDAHILSPPVIQEIMHYGLEHDLSMLTYSPAIALLGPSVYVTVDAADIAEQVTRLLDADTAVHREGLSRLGNAPIAGLAFEPR